MRAWLLACAAASVSYAAVSVVRHWRREHQLTEECRAEEQAKIKQLGQRIAEHVEAHKTHRARWRRDPDGIWYCSQCEPEPPKE